MKKKYTKNSRYRRYRELKKLFEQGEIIPGKREVRKNGNLIIAKRRYHIEMIPGAVTDGSFKIKEVAPGPSKVLCYILLIEVY